MIPALQSWEKIVKELQKTIKMKNPRNDIMCQNKWNSLNLILRNLQTIARAQQIILVSRT
jgi:hypothetical protein